MLLVMSCYKKRTLDICSPTPKSHIIQLLPTCRVQKTGQNFLDVGKCSDGPCPQSSSFNQSCGRGKEYCCCGPKGDEYLEGVLIECSTSYDPQPVSLMEVYRVKECACFVCTETEGVIKGESSFFFHFCGEIHSSHRDPFIASLQAHSLLKHV